MRARFYLRSNAVERSEIMLVVRQGSASKKTLQELRVHTGLSVKPKQWGGGVSRHIKSDRQKANTIDAVVTNRALDQIEAKVAQLADEARIKGVSTLDYLKQNLYSSGVLRSRFSQTQADIVAARIAAQHSVLHHFQQFIADREQDQHFRQSTVKTYKVVFNHLNTMMSTSRTALKFNDIDKEWFADWKNYLMNEAKLTSNTIQKHIAIFKVFLGWCDEKGYCDSRDYKRILDTKGLLKDAQSIALTQEEVSAIEALDLSSNDRLSRSRDVFLLSIYTGMRYSDLASLKPEHINGSRLEKNSVKTSSILKMELKKRSLDILARYPDGLAVISEQKLNIYIKELCSLAGMASKSSQRTRFRGAEAISETQPRSQMVSIHTGRRTFVTLSFDAGHTARDIMKTSGHKDYETLMKYDKASISSTKRDSLKQWWDERGSV